MPFILRSSYVGCFFTCLIDNFRPPFECVTPDQKFSSVAAGQKYDNCTCVNNKHTCSQRTVQQEVPHLTTRTTTELYNLASKDIELYLLQTSERFTWNRYVIQVKCRHFVYSPRDSCGIDICRQHRSIVCPTVCSYNDK